MRTEGEETMEEIDAKAQANNPDSGRRNLTLSHAGEEKRGL